MAGFPNVPIAPGVPPLLRAPGLAAVAIVLLAKDLASALFGIFVPPWGIYLDGVPQLPSRSTLSFDYRWDANIANYQIENGGFESYDKVELPFDVRVRVASGPTANDRQALILAVERIKKTLELYDVVTPEHEYLDCNVSHVDLHRDAGHGVGMIEYDIWLTEVRERGATAFSQTQQPSGADAVANGNVQTTQNSSFPDGFAVT